MRITSGGNVGIGTTSPNSILEITATTPVFRIQASDSANFHGIEFRQGAGFDAFIKQLPSTGEFRISNGRSVDWGGHMTFYTDTVERMRITSTGTIQVNNTIVSYTGASGAPTTDTSVSFTSLANGAYLDFPSMSGMILVNNTGTGAVQAFLCGGGNVLSLGYVVNNTGNMAHSPGVGGYRFTNNTGSTWIFSFQVFKTRGTA